MRSETETGRNTFSWCEPDKAHNLGMSASKGAVLRHRAAMRRTATMSGLRQRGALTCSSFKLTPACLAMPTICSGVTLVNMLCMLAIMFGSFIKDDKSGIPPGPILHIANRAKG